VRDDEKPFRAGSSNPGWFRVRVNRSYPEGRWLLLRISTGARLWRYPERGPPSERRRKAEQTERALRGGHGVQARPVKTFRKVGDAKNGTAEL
jgi:hypothetical protein